jgi:hypothetical protein
MARFAVIQDGTELARQTEADITGCFEQCGELLSADGGAFEPTTYTDEAVGPLLDRISPDEYQCLVVASNALTSGQIERVLARRRENLSRYLAAGGGIVVLHQLVDSLASFLPDDLAPTVVARSSARGDQPATAYDPDDILLRYPCEVDLAGFTDGGAPDGPPSLFYVALAPRSLPERLKPVLRYGTEVLVARSYDHVAERVVIATLPLDWQRSVSLLANAIRLACAGPPRRLVWHSRPAGREQLLVEWLSADGRASVRPPVPDGAPLDATQRWLLHNVDLVVVPADRLPAARDRPELSRFLARGGVLVAPHDDPPAGSASRVTAIVGGHTEAQLARRLSGELRAVAGWAAADYAFELRNIVTALAYLERNPVNQRPGSVELAELASLEPDLVERLRDPRHREDLSSSLAHLQSLAFLTAPAKLHPEVYEWVCGSRRRERYDVGLQIRAVTALATRRADPDFGVAAAAELRSHQDDSSLPAVIRVLDAVAVLDQAGLLRVDPAQAAELVDLSCAILERHPPDQGAGWLSVEGTADATRGLVALLDRLPAGDGVRAGRVADRIGPAAGLLRQALRRYERNRKGVAWLARVVHAVVAVDRCFPIGLQRLAEIEWPGRAGEPPSTAGTEHTLTEYLALENKRLRDREREFADARLAARVGRAVATVGGATLVAAPFGYLLVRLGAESVWSLLGNIAILATSLLAIVAGVFSLLARWRLLAAPAGRVLEWISTAIPVLSALSGLRRRRATSQ